MAVAANELFVFAGAGVSISPPAGLPMFNWLRDEVLQQLGLHTYVAGDPRADPARVAVAAGLAPEPFMMDLRLGGVAVSRWLELVLDGEPNAAHHALAQLAKRGATVWTVNFDLLIEKADPSLGVLAWPAAPIAAADIVKPHGSLGGELILGADQVLRGLEEAWRERLIADVAGRTVIFVGYSGRDLDFQPIWDQVLAHAREVVWFDQPDPAHPGELLDAQRRRLLLREVDARGALILRAAPDPDRAVARARPNSAADFVNWCSDQGLVSVAPTLISQMFAPPDIHYPPLEGERARARVTMLGHLGDYRAAQHERLAMLGRPGLSRQALAGMWEAAVTEANRPMRVMMLATRALPPVGRLAHVRDRAERKRLTALHREARHAAVLRATANLDENSLSTLLILRASALRLLGSLDEAADLADDAFDRARREDHAVRTAHAAFQKAIALVWAERSDDARLCLENQLRPYASLAANRWVAWSHFIEGTLAVRAADAPSALTALDLSERLFAAEALMDGVISVRLARLSARRLAGDDAGWRAEAERVRERGSSEGRDWRFYAARSDISKVALALERGEFARVHARDASLARRQFELAAACRYPLFASLGELGLACSGDGAAAANHARRALALAQPVGARLVLARAASLAADPGGPQAEVFFC